MVRLSASEQGQPEPVPRFCNVAIPHTRLDVLTYAFDSGHFTDLAPGSCVQVRLRGKKVKGLVLDVVSRSPVAKTLPIEKHVEAHLVPEQLLRLLRWVGAYYFGRMGEVLGLALPRGICGYGLRRRGRAEGKGLSEPPPEAVADQPRSSFTFASSFAVYVHADRDAGNDAVTSFIAQGMERGTVIFLMPESEIDSWAARLRLRFAGEPVVYGGDQRASARKRIWRELRSAERRLVLGVRSAVFAPVTDLAGVVVLDEHDRVFKEERHPRLNARDVAIARARLADCPVVLCDPTPSAETWLNLRTGLYQAARRAPDAPRPADAAAGGEPDTIVVDMRKHGEELLAPVLANALKEAHAAGESAVLYMNRRGLSRYVVCRDCGSPLSCPDCAVSFVLFPGGDLRCRYCGQTGIAPEACQACGSHDFRFRVPGVEMAVQEVARLLPDAEVVTVVAESIPRTEFEPGTFVVGTRALLGNRWPEHVKVIAALSVDADLCMPDFRARERTFQVLSVLSRRAVEHGATFILQTRRPEDAAIQCALAGDVARFLEGELKLREELGFPPSRRLALVELSAGSRHRADRRGEWLSQRLGRARGVEALGPVPARGRANVSQVLVKLDRNVRLDRLVTLAQLEADGVKAKVDIDPLDAV
jgi:primosomal protein N' (replication factor Y)